MNRLLSWIWLLGAVAVVLGGIGFVVPAAPNTVRTARFRAEAEELWQAVSDLGTQSEWRRDVRQSLALPDRNERPAWREQGTDGYQYVEVLQYAPPERIVVSLSDPAGCVRVRRSVSIVDERLYREVVVREEVEVPNVYRKLFYRATADPRERIDSYLVDLGRRFDQDVAPRKPQPKPAPFR